MQNITTTLKKLFYLWRRSQVPVKQPIKISRIDNLIIFLVCILISVISSYKLLLISPLNFADIFSWFWTFTEILISCGVLILVSKKENPTISSRQIFLIITLLLAVQVTKLANFVTCTAKRRVMIKKICLEEIVGFSFFETNIKTPQLISISVKVQNQEKISAKFKGEIRSNL